MTAKATDTEQAIYEQIRAAQRVLDLGGWRPRPEITADTALLAAILVELREVRVRLDHLTKTPDGP